MTRTTARRRQRRPKAEEIKKILRISIFSVLLILRPQKIVDHEFDDVGIEDSYHDVQPVTMNIVGDGYGRFNGRVFVDVLG